MAKKVMTIKVKNQSEIKSRTTWVFSTVNRIKPSKKAYDRKDKSWKKEYQNG